MHFDSNASELTLSADLPEGVESITLKSEETSKLLQGQSFLRKGLIVRRLGDIIELRNARPGIASDRRILATYRVADLAQS